MPDWLIRNFFLTGLPKEVAAECLRSPELRRLLRFRFAYIFTFHAPVLVPLLEILGGKIGPATGLLSLGLASLVMVLCDVPTGLYADRKGARASLRLGLLLMCGAMVGFFGLSVWRALTPSAAAAVFLPGVIGMFVLEIVMGLALSFLSGADTVFFLAVARRANIPGLRPEAFEGTGNALRQLGTMVAVGLGAIAFHLAPRVGGEREQIILQGGLFLCTLLAQWVALAALLGIPDPGVAPGPRPSLRDVAQSLRLLAKRSPLFLQFWAQIWTLCLCGAMALLAGYLLQSPLSALARELNKSSAYWLPVYPLVLMASYWAAARGSRAFASHRYRQGSRPVDPLMTLLSAPLTVGLLLWYPLFHQVTAKAEFLTLVAAVMLVLFGLLRGFVEPLAQTAIVNHAQTEGIVVPVTLVSAWSGVKRAVHFTLSLAFFFGYQSRGGDDPSRLSDALLFLAFSFAVLVAAGLLLPVFLERRAQRAQHRPLAQAVEPPSDPSLEMEMTQTVSTVVIGSYREDLRGLFSLCELLRDHGVEVLHPPKQAIPMTEDAGFVRLNIDPSRDEGVVQSRVFRLIDQADAVVVFTPTGRIGISTAMEIGYALRSGKPVLPTAPPTDVTIRRLVAPEVQGTPETGEALHVAPPMSYSCDRLSRILERIFVAGLADSAETAKAAPPPQEGEVRVTRTSAERGAVA